ncbi:MAG: flagellar regulator YcgR PilZN domain-containing protein [Oceanicoccus sp.]
MAFLKTLINRIFSGTNKDTSNQVDHYSSLEKLRVSHEWLDVKVTKTNHSYQSLVLEIDIENNELLIDELFPPEHLDDVQSGDTVQIITRSKRQPVDFYTRILSREFSNGTTSWRLELPTEIGANHNRNAFRVYVEGEPGLEIEIYQNDQALADVRIINLSMDGLKLSFNNETRQLLDDFQILEDCLIRLPNDSDIDCSIELRNLYDIRTPYPHLLGGGKLVIADPQQRVKLQQFLASIQRKQRRRESRV